MSRGCGYQRGNVGIKEVKSHGTKYSWSSLVPSQAVCAVTGQWVMHPSSSAITSELPWCQGDVDAKEMMPVPKKWSLMAPSTAGLAGLKSSCPCRQWEMHSIVKCHCEWELPWCHGGHVSRKCSWSTRCLWCPIHHDQPSWLTARGPCPRGDNDASRMYLYCSSNIYWCKLCAHWSNSSALSTQLGVLYYQRAGSALCLPPWPQRWPHHFKSSNWYHSIATSLCIHSTSP